MTDVLCADRRLRGCRHSNKTTTDLAAVLKNLVDQHKIVQDGEYYSLA